MTNNKSGYLLDKEMEDLVTYGEQKSYTVDANGKWVESTTPPLVQHRSGTVVKTPAFPVCSHYGEYAFTSTDGIVFYGATGRLADFFGLDAVFDLNKGAIASYRRSSTVVTSGALELNKYTLKMPKFIDIDWPDMSIIQNAGFDFWSAVLAYIREQKFETVLVACTGGNGRTGSFLSILYGLDYGVHGPDAIAQIRKEYCKHAVETKEQEQYIEDVIAGKF